MKKYIIIPARFSSTRLPGKMLLMIKGKPLIYYSWKNACFSKKADDVIIATDNKDIYESCHDFGAKIVMTKASHKTGTDRIAEAIYLLKLKDEDIVVNVQGDEPLLPPKIIDSLFEEMENNDDASIITVATKIKDKEEVENNSFVKVILNKKKKLFIFLDQKYHLIAHLLTTTYDT